jgi:hypothetical protein
VAVLDTLLDYYEFRRVADRNDPEPAPARQKLLLERITLPPRGAVAEPEPAGAVAPPHAGPLPLMLRPGAVHNSHAGSGVALTLRPANYDALSLDGGRIAHSVLAMFELKAVVLAGELRLRSFDLLNIENPNAARTPLPGDGGLAWKLRAGLESHNLECGRCTVPKITGGLGKAFAAGREGLVFARLDLSAQASHAGSGTLAATPRAGLLAVLAPGWKSGLSVGRQSFLNGARGAERIARWENRFGASRKWDLRLSYEQHAARELEAAVSLYW